MEMSSQSFCAAPGSLGSGQRYVAVPPPHSPQRVSLILPLGPSPLSKHCGRQPSPSKEVVDALPHLLPLVLGLEGLTLHRAPADHILCHLDQQRRETDPRLKLRWVLPMIQNPFSLPSLHDFVFPAVSGLHQLLTGVHLNSTTSPATILASTFCHPSGEETEALAPTLPWFPKLAGPDSQWPHRP